MNIDPFLTKIKADLGIAHITVRVQVKHAPECYAVRQGASYLIVLRKAMKGRALVRALAHELRHVWQEESGLLTTAWGENGEAVHVWRGTPQTCAYEEQAHEVDARAYDAQWA